MPAIETRHRLLHEQPALSRQLAPLTRGALCSPCEAKTPDADPVEPEVGRC
jgi:hypothetical protein